MEGCPIRETERARGRIVQTECVKTHFSRLDFQDALVWVNVGRASDLVAILFPDTSSKILTFLLDKSFRGSSNSLSSDSQQLDSSLPNIGKSGDCSLLGECFANYWKAEDQAYFTLKGASFEAVTSIFSHDVTDAIETSQLRLWERDHLLLDTTDCVVMQVWRGIPHRAVIRLRMGFVSGMNIATKLYADDSIVF